MPAKKAAKKAPAAKRGNKKKGNGAGVRVRMYRQGLGDCFLIAIPKNNGDDFFLMIDCGVVLGTEKPADKMRPVVEDVIKVTGGRVDVLAATHEHWDHLSGFIQVEDLFAKADDKDKSGKLEVGAVWFAWTEDPKNKLALALKKERGDKIKALRLAVTQLHGAAAAMGLDSSPLASGIDELLGFFGAAGKNSTSQALQTIREFTSEPPRYCHPEDDPIEVPDLSAFRIYVMGPPQDETLIKKTGSSTELYKDQKSFAEAAAWTLALSGADKTELPTELQDFTAPFDRNDCISLSDVQNSISAESDGNQTLQFFDRYYFGKDTDSAYVDQRWRRIDSDWMSAGAEFALALDSATNNTSLVLAIEHIQSGKVLLFAADAQVGNWLSWQDVKWTVNGKTVTGPDLLRRTVLYKVGHHGSHNATLKAKGLELMISDDLCALIPVNHAMAVKKRWGRMPLPTLVDALRSQTKGRLLQVDQDFNAAQVDSSVRDEFASCVKSDDLYFEVTVRV